MHTLSFLLTASTLCLPLFASTAANATDDLCRFSSSARFVESAPRDRFVLENTSSGNWRIATASLDLSTSAGNLIFDVTAEGAGVEVFQPFRAESGEATLATEPKVIDGDQTMVLMFTAFSPNDSFQFSIDVDDQLTDSELGQIRVSGGEMAGATLVLKIMDNNGKAQSIKGAFDQSNQLVLDKESC